jgi:hypothetical protein
VSKVENVGEFWDFGNETVYDTNQKKKAITLEIKLKYKLFNSYSVPETYGL